MFNSSKHGNNCSKIGDRKSKIKKVFSKLIIGVVAIGFFANSNAYGDDGLTKEGIENTKYLVDPSKVFVPSFKGIGNILKNITGKNNENQVAMLKVAEPVLPILNVEEKDKTRYTQYKKAYMEYVLKSPDSELDSFTDDEVELLCRYVESAIPDEGMKTLDDKISLSRLVYNRIYDPEKRFPTEVKDLIEESDMKVVLNMRPISSFTEFAVKIGLSNIEKSSFISRVTEETSDDTVYFSATKSSSINKAWQISKKGYYLNFYTYKSETNSKTKVVNSNSSSVSDKTSNTTTTRKYLYTKKNLGGSKFDDQEMHTTSRGVKTRIPYTDRDLYLLAKLITCEYGTNSSKDIDYKVAVGVVAINRIMSKGKGFPGTIHDVIAQRVQFTCVWDGSWEKKEPKDLDYTAARLALEGKVINGVNGKILDKDVFWYMNPSTSEDDAAGWIRTRTFVDSVGLHEFYK